MASREVMAGSLLEMGFSEIEIDCVREEGTGSKRTAIDDAEREDGSQYESGEEEEEIGEDDNAVDYDDDKLENVLRSRCSEARVEVGAR